MRNYQKYVDIYIDLLASFSQSQIVKLHNCSYSTISRAKQFIETEMVNNNITISTVNEWWELNKERFTTQKPKKRSSSSSMKKSKLIAGVINVRSLGYIYYILTGVHRSMNIQQYKNEIISILGSENS